MTVTKLSIVGGLLITIFNLSATVNAAEGPAGPGWIQAQGTPVTPQEADAYYQFKDMFQSQAALMDLILVQSAANTTPEITALARALKNDPKLIYEYVRNNVEYVPYFGSLKGATLTYLDGSGNDFDQASLMIALLRESGYTAQYVYGQQWIPAYGNIDQKDMQHWLGVDADNYVISTVLANGGIPATIYGSYWMVNRVWVQVAISGTNYLFDPAFKPNQITQSIDIKSAMGYSKSALISAAGGTLGTDYVQNLNESGLKSVLDGYTMNLAEYIRANYPNARTNEIIGGSKIVPQTLTALPTSLDFPNSTQYYWTDIPDSYIHKVRIQHGGIDQTLNIPDLAGQKLSIVYKAGTITTMSAMTKSVASNDPQPNLAPLGSTTIDIQAAVIPAEGAVTTLPDIPLTGPSVDPGKRKSDSKTLSLASSSSADFGKIYPPAAGTSSSQITWGPLTNPNPVTVQVVAYLTSNPYGAYAITTGSGTTNLGPGQSMNVTVKFSNAGQSAGIKTGQLRIQWLYNGGSIGDYYYDLTGIVGNPLTLTGSYGVNVQAYMYTPYVDTARLQNSGVLPLTINSMSLTGTGASRFQFVSGYGAGTIPAGGYRDIQVRYLADVHGTQPARINISMTYDGLAYSGDILPLQGQAFYEPNLTGSYGFNAGTPYLGNAVDDNARLKNSGSQILFITGVSLTGTDAARFQLTGGNGTGYIAAGQYLDIGIRYLANSIGTHTANLHITFTYDGKSTFIDLPLSGQTVSTPVAQLWLDDQMLVEETEPITGANLDKMTVSVTHPYSTTFADQSVEYTLKRGSTYAIIYDFGGSRLGRLLEKRERQMQTYRESGLADTSRQVLTESLNVIGMTWMRDTTLNDNLLGQIAGVIDLRQHRFGVVAQETGYYIDVKAQLSAISSIHGDTVANDGYFKAVNHLASAMEHGVLEQMQANSPSVSTVKLLQLNNASGKKTFRVDSANYANIKPQLSNYSTQDLDDFQASVNGGNTLILPENGRIALQSWAGKGYIDFSMGGSSQHVGMIIGGGYSGGYGANNTPLSIAPVSTQVNLNITPSAITPRIPSTDPVDMVTGYWLYSNTDLTLSGGMGGLALKRSYNSGNNNMKDSLGYGWSHNYRIYVEPHSSSPFGLGQRQPLDAAALMVASVATLDVMNGTPDLKSWMIGALIGKWAMDNLTNNAASVRLETDVLTFVKLPDGSFASPPGVTSKLVLNNGLYRVDERFNRTVNFNSSNNVSSITDVDGNSVGFTYSGGKLQSVADNFGHSLTFNYTGNLLTSVDDSAGRSVSYGYTGDDLTTYTDPEGKGWTYSYDGSSHRVKTLKNPRNITTVSNVYDTFGRVESQTMPRQTGSTTYNLYFSGYRNIEEDGSGHQTIYYFDDQKHLLGVENALGQRNFKNYDGQGHVISETDPRGYSTGYLYDGNHNLAVVTDPFGKDTVNTYDNKFRLTDVTDPLGHLTHYGYDTEHHPLDTTVYPVPGESIITSKSYYPDGLVKTITDGKGIVTTLVPDGYGNPDTSKTSTAPVIDYDYDAIGRMTALTDQEGARTRLTYDKRSLFTGSIDPLNKGIVLTYYDDGTLWEKTDRNNKTTTYTYTPSGKTDTVTYQGGSTVSFTYDQTDNLVRMQDTLGTTIYAYDAANRLESATDPHNFSIGYGRDASGNIDKITYPGNKTVSYIYDAMNRVKTVTIDWLGKTATYNYDDAGRMTDLTQFNNTYTQYTYDNANRLTDLENRKAQGGPPIAIYGFTLDANGNRTDINQTVPISLNVAAANTAFTMNLPQKNRLQQAGSTAFTYDDEGQLATKAGDTYSFDDAHRVTGITGSVSCQYKYDGSGNRLEAIRNGVTTRYIYDANGNLLAEADGNNVIQKYYIYGDGLVAMVTSSGALYCYHFDGTGHTVALTDASANVVNKYAYTPFGTIGNKVEAIVQPFQFVGKYGVMAEPNGFYYMRARYYDPAVGRFISEDPKGFDGGDVNLMAYTNNNPINKIDPLGLWYIDINATGGSGKGGTAGVQVGPSGVYVYGGVGYGSGGGASVTFNTGDPSPGLSVTATASGGTGTLGGLASLSYDSSGFSKTGSTTLGTVGAGWGVGLGTAVTGTYTYPIWQPKSNKGK